jgi:sugar diacid utilization regulator
MHATYLIPLMERQWPGVCAIEKDSYVVALLNLSVYASKSGKNFKQELAYFLRDNLMLAGVSRTFRGFNRVPSYYRQTELATVLGRERDPMCWYYCFDDYALDCWMKYGVMNFTPEQICSRILLELTAYDRENNTEYYKTLRTFFSRKFSFTHAAEDLFIHRTTLIKRIERIAELTKIDLDDQDALLYIELSFRYLDKNKTL